jgi:hypothetical protein
VSGVEVRPLSRLPIPARGAPGIAVMDTTTTTQGATMTMTEGIKPFTDPDGNVLGLVQDQ